jgi:hypothetical protein
MKKNDISTFCRMSKCSVLGGEWMVGGGKSGIRGRAVFVLGGMR